MFNSFAAYEIASIECGGGGDVWQHTGDLREVDKTIPDDKSQKLISQMTETMDNIWCSMGWQ
jgi:hypothetical protein